MAKRPGSGNTNSNNSVNRTMSASSGRGGVVLHPKQRVDERSREVFVSQRVRHRNHFGNTRGRKIQRVRSSERAKSAE